MRGDDDGVTSRPGEKPISRRAMKSTGSDYKTNRGIDIMVDTQTSGSNPPLISNRD
jgi:hypothetical protein